MDVEEGIEGITDDGEKSNSKHSISRNRSWMWKKNVNVEGSCSVVRQWGSLNWALPSLKLLMIKRGRGDQNLKATTGSKGVLLIRNWCYTVFI